MDTELDEVYIAHIKSMFQEFDNEIIWTAIFERGYDENGNYNTENTINYLLELSGHTNNSQKDKSISTTTTNNETTPINLDKNTNEVDNIPDDIEEDEEEETEPSGISKIITSIPNLFQHGEIKYSKLN